MRQHGSLYGVAWVLRALLAAPGLRLSLCVPGPASGSGSLLGRGGRLASVADVPQWQPQPQ